MSYEKDNDEEIQEARYELEAKTQMPPFQNSFEGRSDSNIFSKGSSDKSVLIKDGGHIARCIHADYVSYIIALLRINCLIMI
jgi:hypothetical protein